MKNTIYCKINAFKNEIESNLKSTDHIIFQGSADISEVRVKDNKDGSKTYTYICVPTLTQIKKSETEITEPKDITVKYHTKKTSRSQALRQKAYVIANELGEDADELYNNAIEFANDYLDNYKDSKLTNY